MIIRLKIDVTKLDKTAFFKGEKGTYCDLAVFVNDEPDQYGQDCSVKQDLGQERRDEKLYVGNGKIVGQKAKAAEPQRRQSTPGRNQQEVDSDSDIPF